MQVKRFVFNMISVNTYVAYDENSLQAAIIDPGCFTQRESRELEEFVEANSLSVKYLLNTHLHFDHIFGNGFVEERWGVKAMAHRADMPWLLHISEKLGRFGVRHKVEVPPVEEGNFLEEGCSLTLGKTVLEVYHVPGHSPGSLVFHAKDEGVIFTGDVLFQESVGRVDFEDSDPGLLIPGIKEKIMTLPDSTLVLPGHGPSTNVGHERLRNPFLV